MAIKLYTGIQGSGKSYEVVTVVILGAIRDGRRVVSNLAGLNYEAMCAILLEEGCDPSTFGTIVQVQHEDVLKPEFWRTDEDHKTGKETIVQGGDLLVLDEIWRFWEGRNSVTERQQNFFRMHRHMMEQVHGFTCEIVLITQDVSDVCQKIRVVVEKTYVMTKHTVLGSTKHYRVDIYARAKFTARTPPLNSLQRTYDPKLYELYKSHSTNDTDVQAQEKTVDKRGTVWQSPIFKYGIPIAIIFMISGAMMLWKILHPASLKPKDETTATSSPGSKDSTPQQTAKPDKLNVDASWRVVGYYQVGGSLTVTIQNSSKQIRIITNPPNFKISPAGVEIELPEGGFVTPWTTLNSSKGLL